MSAERGPIPSERERVEAVVAGRTDVWMPPRARPASTVALLRRGQGALEVYLIRRAPTMSFPAVTAYPGGGHEPEDGPPGSTDAALQAALRELREETDVRLEGPHALVRFARWITPEVLPVRFDTVFFAAALPEDQQPQLVGTEAVEGRWWAPAQALQAAQRREVTLLPPTLATLAQLAPFEDVTQALQGLAKMVDRPLLPRPTQGPDGVRWVVSDADSGEVVASEADLALLERRGQL